MIEFPENFYWGAATSAYQVEGNNTNSDWWEWEKRAGLKETSGWACRHYELYGLDFDLAQQLNHNCHRLSIEWSRIEPKAGEFSREELNHYRDVILSLKERNLEPIVTLHHFTNPLWFAEAGGWENKQAQNYFCRYLEKVLEALSDKVTYWITINEPMVYIYHGFVLGLWPPQKKSLLKAKRVMRHLARAHTQAYRLIHNFYQQRNLINPQVSVAAHLQAFVPCALTLKNKIAVYLRDRFFNFAFLDRLLADKTLDFIGVNYYTRSLVDVERWGLKNLASDSCNKNHHLLPKNSLGWDIYPEGL
jgi:beta-glucosidase